MKLWAEADAILLSYVGSWVGLISAAPALDGSSLVELAFVGYGRALIALGSPFTHVDGTGRTVRRIETASPLPFGPVQAPAAAGVTHVGLFTAVTGGTLRRVLTLASPLPPPALGLLTIATGALALHEA